MGDGSAIEYEDQSYSPVKPETMYTLEGEDDK